MDTVDIYIINSFNEFKLNISDTLIKIKIYIKNKSIYLINNEINKINNIINIYSHIKLINIIFDKTTNNVINNCIITKLNNIFYSNYLDNLNKVKLHNVTFESKNLMKELILYKNIIIDPNKTPETYLKYIKSRIPKNYKLKCFNINKTKLFPLTKAVGSGSIHNSFFVHIYPQNNNNKKKSIYLIGKGVTYDTGGLNIKLGDFSDMKIDMTGSALIISVLNLLVANKIDNKFNIHIITSVVENMIGNKAIKPGTVITSMSNKTIEIINIDAEGRLCLVDGIDYINKYLITDINNSLLIDIATLTGNADQITSTISSIIMSNNKGFIYVKKLIKIGEDLGEYIDYLKIRNEYLPLLNSNVANIKSINTNIRSDCIMAGVFLSYFINNDIPWIHIDLGGIIYINDTPISYGVYLLYEFIKQL